jgi:hypothetical protein
MTDPWVNLEYDLIKDNETTIFYSVTNPWEKIGILSVMDNNPIKPTANNTLRFKLEFIGNGMGNFSVSVNQFKVEVRELENLDTIQPHDPLVQELDFPTYVGLMNGTSAPFGPQTLESLEYNDDEFYKAQAFTYSLAFFITFNVLNKLDSSLWDVDYYEWIASYPNPIIPFAEIRITSNVSKPDNLPLAALALYKGNQTFDILDDETNEGEWIIMSDVQEFAHENETTVVLPFDAGFTWIFLNILNESLNNQATFILLYYTNSSSDFGFNVSINEFSLNFHIQNAITSDIASSIGLGLNNNMLSPSDIKMQNFGTDIIDGGINEGTYRWRN